MSIEFDKFFLSCNFSGMELLLVLSVISSFILAALAIGLAVFVYFTHKQAKNSVIIAENTLDDVKKLIASINQAHNDLAKSVAENGRNLNDLRFAVEMGQKVRK